MANFVDNEAKGVLQIDDTNDRMMQAYQLVAETNQSFFLTGRAGTGKTTFLRNIQKLVDKQFVVVAPTGIAAIVAEGVTIHSFFGLDLNVQGPTDIGKHINADKRRIILSCDTIIIDEVSMLRCDILDAIERTLRYITKSNLPFGGKQIIFVGDLFQLPPVLKSGVEMDAMEAYYGTTEPFFFKAHIFNFISLPTIEFVKVYRQEEQLFLNILNDIRNGVATEEDLAELNARCLEPEGEDSIISLTPYKERANTINSTHLEKLASKAMEYEGVVDGKFGKTNKDGEYLDDSMPAPVHLLLKQGAQVMFTRNDMAGRWVNGTIGVVDKLTKGGIEVRIGKSVYVVEHAEWKEYEYKFDKSTSHLNKNEIGSFKQYPLRLAWAITIHKSQGLTFDKMKLDLSRGTFATGQLYVALSRVRSLDGLYLAKPIKLSDVKTHRDVLNYAAGFNNDTVIEAQIAEGKRLYPYLKSKDYDGAVQLYMQLAQQAICSGNHREACLLFKKMFNVMGLDDVLLNTCNDSYINPADTSLAWFNNAVVSLYGGNYDKAIEYADKILAKRQLYEAYYVKVRACYCLGRYKDADEINSFLGDFLKYDKGGAGYDMKYIFSFANVNEKVGDPYLNAYQLLVTDNPEYLTALSSFHAAMHRANRRLIAEGNDKKSTLVKKFNNTKTTATFIAAAKPLAKEEEYKTLLSVIESQSFD